MGDYLLGTGNHISTALNLKIEEIDFDNSMIALNHTKNRTAQIIPLSQHWKISIEKERNEFYRNLKKEWFYREFFEGIRFLLDLKGTMSKRLTSLKNTKELLVGIFADTKIPSALNRLSREINNLKVELESAGITVEIPAGCCLAYCRCKKWLKLNADFSIDAV